jgi:hypothetical protein
VAKACNCASLGLAFTAIGFILMLLWASAQAVPASVEKSSSRSPPCSFSEDAIAHKRMTHRSDVIGAYSNVDSDDNHEPTVVKSSKNLHERQVRSFEHVNKLAKNKYPHDKNTFVSHESAKSSFDFIRNISSLDDKIMNNGESVSVESISEATLATFKESDVKTNAEKETSDKIYLHVNGELRLAVVFFRPFILPRFSLQAAARLDSRLSWTAGTCRVAGGL